MKFAIKYTRTTFNLELILPGHHLISNKLPVPNSSWSVASTGILIVSGMEFRINYTRTTLNLE